MRNTKQDQQEDSLKRAMEFRKVIVLLLATVVLDNRCDATFTCPVDCRCRANMLSENSVQCIVGGWTSLPPGLDTTVRYLYVSGRPSNQNNFNSLDKTYFQTTPGLLAVTFTFSKIKTIQDDSFSSLNSLRDLDLSNNEIQGLSKNSFSGLSQLRTLDISGNKECQVDKSMFSTILNIEELNMGNMNLRKIPQGMFDSLTKLKVLKLHLNNIKKVRENLITGLPSLTSLDLNGNLLRGIPAEWKPNFKTMNQVHLSENPLQCNCQLLWLRELPRKFYSSSFDTSHIVCNGPDKVKYATFTNVLEEEFVCIPPKVVRCEKNVYSTELGDMIVIKCAYRGDPIPEIKWTRPDGFEIDGTETVKGRYEIFENGTLVINGITLADDGNWKVTAYNKTTSDEKDIQVKVIVTTTSTSTQPTTTLTTTKPTTTVSTTKPVAFTTLSSTKTPIELTENTPVEKPWITTPRDTEGGVHDKGEAVYSEVGINWGLLVAAAAGGATLVSVIFLLATCCKKKQENNDNNQVEPFELDIIK